MCFRAMFPGIKDQESRKKSGVGRWVGNRVVGVVAQVRIPPTPLLIDQGELTTMLGS